MRSRRPAVLLRSPSSAIPIAAVLGAAGLVDVALAALMAARVRRSPAGRLALFRDRLVLIQGRTELRALWDRMELVTLADGVNSWPRVNLTDTLTIRLRGERSLSFR